MILVWKNVSAVPPCEVATEVNMPDADPTEPERCVDPHTDGTGPFSDRLDFQRESSSSLMRMVSALI